MGCCPSKQVDFIQKQKPSSAGDTKNRDAPSKEIYSNESNPPALPDYEEPLHLQMSKTVLEPGLGLEDCSSSKAMASKIKRLSTSILHDPRMTKTVSETVEIPENNLSEQEEKSDSTISGQCLAPQTTQPNYVKSHAVASSNEPLEESAGNLTGEELETQESLTAIPDFAGSLQHEHHHHHQPPLSKDVDHTMSNYNAVQSNEDMHTSSQLEEDSQDIANVKSTSLLPSAGIVSNISTPTSPQPPDVALSKERNEKNDNRRFLAMMKVVCSATDYSSLYHFAANATAIHLQRTTCFSSKFREVLLTLVSNMKCLKILNLSKNNAGPVAFRAIMMSLIRHDCVHELDISDNMSDAECAGMVGKLLATSKSLLKLILSGNQLGKESLSRSLSESLNVNCTLVHLNICGCGASNLHGLFEGLKNACVKGFSCLKHLDISNNHINDLFQFATDMSSVLEHENCKLKYLNVENTGMSSPGWKSILSSLKTNVLLRELVVGGSYNKVQNLVELAEILLASKYIIRLDFSGMKVEQKLISEETWFEVVNPPTMSLLYLDLNNCSLKDDFFTKLSALVSGKFCNVLSLDISNNHNLTEAGFYSLDQLLTDGGQSQLYSLQLAGLSLDFLPTFFERSFPALASISIIKARISADSFSELFGCPQVLCEVMLDGIKMSGTNMLDVIFTNNTHHHFTKITLRDCALTDADLSCLVTALYRHGPPLVTLLHLDLSVNRLSAVIIQNVFAALLSNSNHCLEILDLNNNVIEDAAACDAAKCILSPSCKSNLKHLNFSCNKLTRVGIEALVQSVAAHPDDRGLVSLDVSNQSNPMGEEELECIIETLATSIGMDGTLLMPEDVKQPIPFLSSKFSVNLSELGGSAGPRTKMLDSFAIKTDFTKVCNTSATVTDFLLIGAGLDRIHQGEASGASSIDAVVFTDEEWSSVVGAGSPAWLKIDEKRRKSVYISRLPASTTLQRLEGLLEMEADCDISDSYLVKDPVLQKPAGSAWFLFANEKSVEQAMQWYAYGEAQMYGTPFCISVLPVVVSGENTQKATEMAEKEKLAHEKQRKQTEDNDRAVMEESQQLAEERAAYREAHPAYQNGRIW